MQDIVIRRLRRHDHALISSHFNSLDEDVLLSRFGTPVQPQGVQDYLSNMFADAAFVFGAFPDSCLRGVGELRLIPDHKYHVAEAAFTVEKAWQDQGIGDALLSRLITIAQNRGIREVHMLCLATNQKMRRLAAKHNAELTLVPGQVEATLTTPWPTPFSMAKEITSEYRAFARAVLSWPNPTQASQEGQD
ncbi:MULTISPECIES: GNAT family N-acetyltransferase [unclassified Ruegeria]|uniref:GNAT family N-acetyltransferase n=1 Tax=unclassified Ruegeria TaxID=2625375 RepID=UPI001489EA2D|nr:MULTISPECIES: GNAT family N-acetyltransferase [unclassified Ruegeria]NOD75019.1 GNAT family N-acetyltransferase [Ruegeria sp. HKCCD4332]NOD86980.1 GNAT family N-acetyltransferase [Ruegeria sp. HKCCD4318]NOE12535.1 GNAT family N-acetyltransferase [Ruegeria sp. HKCCD4318-2]NOG09300.1 GNAT family N-acetyltransferase [Ruegeria sp. HKCCD4315]